MSKASDNFNRVFAQKIFGDDLIDEDATKEAVEAGLDTMMINPDPFEHERLQLAVVEAAKALVEIQSRSPLVDDGSISLSLQLRFEDAVHALIKFEAEQKNGNT